ncbi:hypothetical protein FDI40_gp108 [Agrobacterium phage Atu_ph07]|uniref:Uncharacterized protein n=1 Tax=Agrobacterium phage Atu_ph07 TaxID=2024264 RepID=A0A2L0UZE1_9CAUD|nr:hypothetical protein FDI40_gp108 [Agrobacterium phage Atu_ph07]AUZ94907.1 hypothetical protein [Agrobacterium phage Atu_ph07]
MANMFSSAANDIFNLLKSSGRKVTLFDEQGNKIYKTKDARKFFAVPDRLMIVLEDDNNDSFISLYFGNNIDAKDIASLISSLRNIAVQYGLLFDIRKYGKKLSPKDFAYQATPIVSENKETKMFKTISLSNAAQRVDLQRHMTKSLGLKEGVDFAVFGNNIVCNEGYTESTKYLVETTSAVLQENSDVFLKYATEWVNTRTGLDRDVNANEITNLAKGFKDIISNKLDVHIVKPAKEEKFSSNNLRFASELERVVNSNLNNSALKEYIGSVVDKLRHNEKLNPNEQFFTKKLVDIVEHNAVIEALDEDIATYGVEGDPELGQYMIDTLVAIKQEADSRGIDLTDGVYSMEDLACALVCLMKAYADDRIDTLIPNHYEDFVKAIRGVFGTLSFEHETPEVLAFDRWVNVSVVEGKTSFDVKQFFKQYGVEFVVGHTKKSEVVDSIAQYLVDFGGYKTVKDAHGKASEIFKNFVKKPMEKELGFVFESFDVNGFFKEYGTDYWLGRDPRDKSKRYEAQAVIPSIANFLVDIGQYNNPIAAEEEAENVFYKYVKPALEKDHGFIFEDNNPDGYKGFEEDERKADSITFNVRDFIDKYGSDFNFGRPSPEQDDMKYSSKEIIDSIEHYLHNEFDISERFDLSGKASELFRSKVKGFLENHDYIFENYIGEDVSEDTIVSFATDWIDEYLSKPQNIEDIKSLIDSDDTPEVIKEVIQSTADDIIFMAGEAADRDFDVKGTPSIDVAYDKGIKSSTVKKIEKIIKGDLTEAYNRGQSTAKDIYSFLELVLPQVSVYEKDYETFKKQVMARVRKEFSNSMASTNLISGLVDSMDGKISSYYDRVSKDRLQTGFTLGGDVDTDFINAVKRF